MEKWFTSSLYLLSCLLILLSLTACDYYNTQDYLQKIEQHKSSENAIYETMARLIDREFNTEADVEAFKQEWRQQVIDPMQQQLDFLKSIEIQNEQLKSIHQILIDARVKAIELTKDLITQFNIYNFRDRLTQYFEDLEILLINEIENQYTAKLNQFLEERSLKD